MKWWLENDIRLIQNNFRDIDVMMDVEKYVENLKDFHANTCMVGCGGITAHYPTELDFHFKNPYMTDDFFQRLISCCHENDIRVIARFDFSKTNAAFFEDNKNWYTKSIHGNEVRFHDTVATCVNGDYQQECSLKILEEVINKYPVDGVFFNMFGYQTYDYSDNYVGICQCDSCKKKFKEYSGMELPNKEVSDDPAYIEYLKFKQFTVDELLKKISSHIRNLNPDIPVCTYNHVGVDMPRNESNSAVGRALPFLQYHSEHNTSIVKGSFDNKILSNCVINAVDIFFRFMGVSKYLNQSRLYGEMAAGTGLDWCIIGNFEDYPDRDNFESTKEVFKFREIYSDYYKHMEPLSEILLVAQSAYAAHADRQKEYLGIFKMLKEEHILFDSAEIKSLSNVNFNKYKVVVLPDIKELEEDILKKIFNSGALVIGTASSLKEKDKILKEEFNIHLLEKESARGGYMETTPKEIFKSFPNRDWVYIDKEYFYTKTDDLILPYVLPARYGPPERCFGHKVSNSSAVAISKNVYFPWQIGRLYYEHGYEDFKNIFVDILKYKMEDIQIFKTNANPQVELFFDRVKDGYLLQMINYSGFNGMTFFKPIELNGITFELNKEIISVKQLTLNGELDVQHNKRSVELPSLNMFNAFFIKTKE